jgi:hypothetical protein
MMSQSYARRGKFKRDRSHKRTGDRRQVSVTNDHPISATEEANAKAERFTEETRRISEIADRIVL